MSVAGSPGITSQFDVYSLFPCQILFENVAVTATTVPRGFQLSQFLKMFASMSREGVTGVVKVPRMLYFKLEQCKIAAWTSGLSQTYHVPEMIDVPNLRGLWDLPPPSQPTRPFTP